MCCLDDDFRKNAALAAVFDVGTASAIFVVNIIWLRIYDYISWLMYGYGILVLLGSILSLVYTFQLKDLLKQNKWLRLSVWILLGLSILIQAPLLYFVSSVRSADDAKINTQDALRQPTNTRSDALIAVYILVTFHTLCSISMMCAFRSASKERSYAIEQSEYEKEYEDEEYNSRYEEEMSPNKPVVSFGDQQNPAGSFVTSSEDKEYSHLDSPRVPLNSVAVNMTTHESNATLDQNDVISNHSELNFSHYSGSPRVSRSHPKLSTLSTVKRDTSRRSDNSLYRLNPRIYKRVKSIDLELGGSDDEDIASKSTLVIGRS